MRTDESYLQCQRWKRLVGKTLIPACVHSCEKWCLWAKWERTGSRLREWIGGR